MSCVHLLLGLPLPLLPSHVPSKNSFSNVLCRLMWPKYDSFCFLIRFKSCGAFTPSCSRTLAFVFLSRYQIILIAPKDDLVLVPDETASRPYLFHLIIGVGASPLYLSNQFQESYKCHSALFGRRCVIWVGEETKRKTVNKMVQFYCGGKKYKYFKGKPNI